MAGAWQRVWAIRPTATVLVVFRVVPGHRSGRGDGRVWRRGRLWGGVWEGRLGRALGGAVWGVSAPKAKCWSIMGCPYPALPVL